MSIETKTAKQAIHDELESHIKNAEAKLDTLKARADVAKANLEIKAIADLTARKLELHQKLQELKTAGNGHGERIRADLEAKIAAFEKSVKEIESKVKAH